MFSSRTAISDTFDLGLYGRKLSTLGILGRKGDAREALERALNLQPELSVGFIKLALPITHEPSRDHFFDGLIKAGVAE